MDGHKSLFSLKYIHFCFKDEQKTTGVEGNVRIFILGELTL